ncbi:hypothetical protein DPMN_011888 [Dreissena polymorpha]|uniref:Uncharacterized protein n=1 Tax=Dreissena polymorpha TaxID=45954 RepID=A0A9D4S0S0_DREPO|nr:hypothetical protein DPMN_011888 [Dreissena polymorpha]
MPYGRHVLSLAFHNCSMVLRYSSDPLSFTSAIIRKSSMECLPIIIVIDCSGVYRRCRCRCVRLYRKVQLPGHCAACEYATDSTDVAGTEFRQSLPHTRTYDSADS